MPPRSHLLILLAAILGLAPVSVWSQAPGVAVVNDREYSERVVEAGELLKVAGKLKPVAEFDPAKAATRCSLELPAVQTQPLTPQKIHEHARKATLNIGQLYLCTKCDHWHTNLSGGYAVTADGVAASCFHVLESTAKEVREAYLIAADADGQVFAVTEVLAADKAADVVLVRTAARNRQPLALNRDGRPGDAVFCLSNPKGVHEFFSQGTIARYFSAKGRRVFLHVTCDWAAGSSGAAVLDQAGNALGHVTATRTLLWRDAKPAPKDVQMTLKEAASAQEILRLTQPPTAQ